MPQNSLDGEAYSQMEVVPDVLDTDRVPLLRPTRPDPANQNVTVTYRRFAYALLPGVLASLGPTLALKADLDPGTHLVPANELPTPTFAALADGPFSNPQLGAVLISLLNTVDDGITAIDYADLAGTIQLVPGRLYRIQNRTDGSGLDVLAFAGTNNDLEGADAYTVPDGLDAPTLPVSYDQVTDTVGDRSTTLPPPIESQYQEVSRAGAVLLLAYGGVKPIRYRIHRADPATGYVDIPGFAPDGDSAQDCRFSPDGEWYDPGSNTTTLVGYDVINDVILPASNITQDLSNPATTTVPSSQAVADATNDLQQQISTEENDRIDGDADTLADAQSYTDTYAEKLVNKATSLSTNDNTHYPTTAAVNTAIGAEATARTNADALLAPKASPALTGTPTAPTAATGDSSSQLANTAFVSGAIDTALVGAIKLRGNYDIVALAAYPSTGGSGTSGAIKAYNAWVVSNPGTYDGVTYDKGDWLVALVNTPGQTTANWTSLDYNQQQATTSSRGTVFLALLSEVIAAADGIKAITSATLAGWWANIKSTAQTISGIWTYTASPIVPDATTAHQAMAYGQRLQVGTASGTAGDGAILATATANIAANTTAITANATAITNAATLLPAVTEKTASYTLQLTDAGQQVPMALSSAGTLTVPANASAAFPIGTILEVLQSGAGQITITAASGVTVRQADGWYKTAKQWAEVGLRKRGTDEWVLTGYTTA